MKASCTLFAAAASLSSAAVLDPRQASSSVPQYFQTTPEIYAGPTPTGAAPFLVQTNPAPFGNEASFVANTPLETAIPIAGNTNNASIFQLVGQLSSYFPNPVGFGVNEYPLPPGANISTVHVLHPPRRVTALKKPLANSCQGMCAFIDELIQRSCAD